MPATSSSWRWRWRRPLRSRLGCSTGYGGRSIGRSSGDALGLCRVQSDAALVSRRGLRERCGGGLKQGLVDRRRHDRHALRRLDRVHRVLRPTRRTASGSRSRSWTVSPAGESGYLTRAPCRAHRKILPGNKLRGRAAGAGCLQPRPERVPGSDDSAEPYPRHAVDPRGPPAPVSSPFLGEAENLLPCPLGCSKAAECSRNDGGGVGPPGTGTPIRTRSTPASRCSVTGRPRRRGPWDRSRAAPKSSRSC